MQAALNYMSPDTAKLVSTFPPKLLTILSDMYGISAPETSTFIHMKEGEKHIILKKLTEKLVDIKSVANPRLEGIRFALDAASQLIKDTESYPLEDYQKLFWLCLAINLDNASPQDIQKRVRDAVKRPDAMQALAEQKLLSTEMSNFILQSISEVTASRSQNSQVRAPASPENNQLQVLLENLRPKLHKDFLDEKAEHEKWIRAYQKAGINELDSNALVSALETLQANQPDTSYSGHIDSLRDEDQYFDAESSGDDGEPTAAAPAEPHSTFDDVLVSLSTLITEIDDCLDFTASNLSAHLQRVISYKNQQQAIKTSKKDDTYLLPLYWLSKNGHLSERWGATFAALAKEPTVTRSNYISFIALSGFLLMSSSKPNPGATNLTSRLTLLETFANAITQRSQAGMHDTALLFDTMLRSIFATIWLIDDQKPCVKLPMLPTIKDPTHWMIAVVSQIIYGKALPKVMLELLTSGAGQPYTKPSIPLSDSLKRTLSECIDGLKASATLSEKGVQQSSMVVLIDILGKVLQFESLHDFAKNSSHSLDDRIFTALMKHISRSSSFTKEETLNLKAKILLTGNTTFENTVLLLMAGHSQKFAKALLQSKGALQAPFFKFILSELGKDNDLMWEQPDQATVFSAVYATDECQKNPNAIKQNQATATQRFLWDSLSEVFKVDADYSVIQKALSTHGKKDPQTMLTIWAGCLISPDFLKRVTEQTTPIDEPLLKLIATKAIGASSDEMWKSRNATEVVNAISKSGAASSTAEIVANSIGVPPKDLAERPIETALNCAGLNPNRISTALGNHEPLQNIQKSTIKLLTSHVTLSCITTSMACTITICAAMTLMGASISMLYAGLGFIGLSIVSIGAQWLGTRYIIRQFKLNLNANPLSAEGLVNDCLYSKSPSINSFFSASKTHTPGA